MDQPGIVLRKYELREAEKKDETKILGIFKRKTPCVSGKKVSKDVLKCSIESLSTAISEPDNCLGDTTPFDAHHSVVAVRPMASPSHRAPALVPQSTRSWLVQSYWLGSLSGLELRLIWKSCSGIVANTDIEYLYVTSIDHTLISIRVFKKIRHQDGALDF